MRARPLTPLVSSGQRDALTGLPRPRPLLLAVMSTPAAAKDMPRWGGALSHADRSEGGRTRRRKKAASILGTYILSLGFFKISDDECGVCIVFSWLKNAVLGGIDIGGAR